MANQKGTTVYLTHPRILVMLLLLAIYVVASIAIAVSDKLEARRNNTPAPEAPHSPAYLDYVRRTAPGMVWQRVPLDIVARPMTTDEMVAGARHLPAFEAKVRAQAIDTAQADAWDVRVERAMRKLTAPSTTTCVVEYEEGNETVRWMDVTVAASGLRIGLECGTFTLYGDTYTTDNGNGAWVEVLTGDERRHGMAGRDLGRADFPLLSLERWNARPTHSMGWAD